MTGNAKRPGFKLLPLLLHRRAASRLLLAAALVPAIAVWGTARAGGPQGQITWGIHVTMAPTWFDPA